MGFLEDARNFIHFTPVYTRKNPKRRRGNAISLPSCCGGNKYRREYQSDGTIRLIPDNEHGVTPDEIVRGRHNSITITIPEELFPVGVCYSRKLEKATGILLLEPYKKE